MGDSEIELKLELDPGDMALLKRQPLLRAYSRGRPRTKLLKSVYFDTPERDLAQAGISLRVRAVGAQRIQTVKAEGVQVAGLFSRREWECEIAGDAPEPEQLRGTGLAAFAEDGLVERLRPLFSTEVKRTAYTLAEPGWEVELALDEGVVRAGDASQPICEAELELFEGEPARLFALARDLAAAVPARLMPLSKSERGYLLSGGAHPGPTKAKPVQLDPQLTAAQAFQVIARSCINHLMINERCLLTPDGGARDHTGGDGEAVHQMRVALRRLRSAVKLFRKVIAGPQLAEIKDEIRWLLDHLGPARDAEVFLTEMVLPVAARHPEAPDMDALVRHWTDHRDLRLEEARGAVGDKRFTALVLAIGAWIEAGEWLAPEQAQDRGHGGEPVGDYAVRRLRKLDRRLFKAAGDKLAALPPEELHQLRIKGKQLRYAGEFFISLFPRKAAKAFLERMSELQDRLGALNDMAVAEPLLTQAAPDQAWAAGMVAGWHLSRRDHLLEEAETLWKQLRKAGRFWEGEGL